MSTTALAFYRLIIGASDVPEEPYGTIDIHHTVTDTREDFGDESVMLMVKAINEAPYAPNSGLTATVTKITSVSLATNVDYTAFE